MYRIILSSIVVMTLVGCGHGGGGTNVSISSFTASPSSLPAGGGNATLSWTTSNATACSIDQGIGSVGVSGSYSVAITNTTIYTLTANGTGGPVYATVTVAVGTAPPVVINSFTASPSSITSGGSSTLSWSTSNAASCSINQGVGSVAVNGSTVVTPTITTTYTLTANGTGGPVYATATVTVSSNPPVVINSFTASPSSITSGGSSTLSWSTSNATSCSIDQGVGSVAVNGSTVVSPTVTTTYTLTANGTGGPVYAQVTVTVVAVYPDLYDDGATWWYYSPNPVMAGDSCSFGFDIRNGGAADAGSFWVDFYLSTNTTISASDYYLGSALMSSGIVAGDYADCDLTGTFPSGIPDGVYYIGALIDANSDVAESNEGNNAACPGLTWTVQSIVLQPDLIVTNTYWDNYTQSSIQFDWAVTNQGNAGSPGFRVGFYLSTNTIISTGDTLIGSYSVASLSAGSSVSQNNITKTFALPNGTYTLYLGVYADDLFQVTESNETNNTGYDSSSMTMHVGPVDLTITNVYWNSYTPSNPASINFDWQGTNQGTGDSPGFRVGFYLSTNTTISTADTLIGSVSYGFYGAGGTFGTTGKVLSFTKPTGTYYLGAYADDLFQVTESNESNNTGYDAVSMVF